MLTLFILSQWTEVYSKVSINLLRMLQNQLASVLQSRVLARQAGVLLSAPPGSCTPGLPRALPLPVSACGSGVSLCLLGYQSRACLKEKEPQCHGPALTCCVPWVVQGCSPELQARLAPLRVCDLHQYLPFRLFPHSPNLLAPWIIHAFGAVPLLTWFLLHITLYRNPVTQNRNLAFVGRGFFQCTPFISLSLYRTVLFSKTFTNACIWPPTS